MTEGNMGYVIAGYLDSEGPDGVTVSADLSTSRPFASVEDAWLWIDEEGGPADDATVVIAKLVPVGLIAAGGATDDDLMRRTDAVEEHFGAFAPDEAPSVRRSTETYDLTGDWVTGTLLSAIEERI